MNALRLREMTCLTHGCRYRFDTIGPVCECRAGHQHPYADVARAAQQPPAHERAEPAPATAPATTPASPTGARLVHLSDVEAKPVRWLWRGRIPLGKLTVLDGDPGLGKTTMLLDVAARVTTGTAMPDGSTSDLAGRAGVVILSAEDGLDDTIRPRLDAAGADVRRAVALVAVRSDDDAAERLPTLGDVEAIRAAIVSVDARLVIIDPFLAYLPSRVESKSDEKIRSVLSPLARLAEETGVSVLLVRHLNKQQSSNALYRGSGTIAIIGAARAGMLVAQDPDDQARRIVAVTKANLAAPVPALAYRLVASDNGAVRVSWDGESEYTADRLLAEHQSHDERSATADAVDWLRELLRTGPRLARDVENDARRSDISPKVLRMAREKLAVVKRRHGFGPGSRVVWELPDRAHRCPILGIDAQAQTVGIYAEYGAGMDAEADGAESEYAIPAWAL